MTCKKRTKSSGICQIDKVRCPGEKLCRHENTGDEFLTTHQSTYTFEVNLHLMGKEIPLGTFTTSGDINVWKLQRYPEIYSNCEKRLSNHDASVNYCMENEKGKMVLYTCRQDNCPELEKEECSRSQKKS